MTVLSFELASDRPTATALKGTTKNGRARTVRLRADTARSVALLFERKLPVARAFTLPDTTHTAEMIRADMAAAGLTEYDASHRKRDFHSLRHTTGTFFNAAGVNPKAAQAVLGHSSIELTMGIYTHTLPERFNHFGPGSKVQSGWQITLIVECRNHATTVVSMKRQEAGQIL